ncbi:MAG TPA: serine hydrolase [Candidatus Saccharimonadales bacterium]|nr:serine hydrolase [Candidatus Saccharimonadales bacterium]
MKRFIMRLCQVVFVLSVIAGSIAGVGALVDHKISAKSASGTTVKEDPQKVAAAQDAFTSSVTSSVNNYSADTLDVGVSMIDLDTGTQTNVGETAAFTAASTTKVLAGAAYLHQVEQGTLSLNQTIDGQSAQTLLQKMINLSDNNAWHDIIEAVSEDNLQAYAQSIGLSSYQRDTNVITASDEAKLLQQLYNHKLINTAHTNLLLSFMQNTSDDDLIPAGLPTGATVYHKYGYLGGELHDAGIIVYNGHRIALTIYTKSSDDSLSDYTSRTTLFHQITAAAITYMKSV